MCSEFITKQIPRAFIQSESQSYLRFLFFPGFKVSVQKNYDDINYLSGLDNSHFFKYFFPQWTLFNKFKLFQELHIKMDNQQ